jgi:hypothetical protein
MPDISEVFGSSSLKADDLKGREVVVMIESVAPKQFDDGQKLILTFRNAKKSFVCNRTNASRISFIHGPDYTLWPGKQICLYAELVDFRGKTTMAIRMKPVAAAAPPSPPVRPTAFDDSVNF